MNAVSRTLGLRRYPFVSRRNPKRILLDPEEWIAKGSKRLVYHHPQSKGVVLKIGRKKTLRKSIRRKLRAPDNIKEFYWCHRIHAAHAGNPFVPKVFGFLPTNLGTALMQERICNSDGSRSSRPSRFVRCRGGADRVRSAVEALFQFLAEQHIVCNDISDQNILIRTRHNVLQAVVIDGFGENHLIPYPSMSKWLNRKKMERKKQGVLRKIDREEKNHRSRRFEVKNLEVGFDEGC
jgi:hypothetical protein